MLDKRLLLQYNNENAGIPAEKEDFKMITVSTYSELEAAVLRDETVIRLEGGAKQFYERKAGDAIGGGVIGALPGLLIAGPIGAAVGAVVGAAVSSSLNKQVSEHDLAKFLLLYYRKSSTGVTYIELTHR